VITRTFSTIVLWLAIGGLLVFFGAPAGALLVILLAATSQHELYGMLEKSGYHPLRTIGVGLGIIYLALAYLMPGYPALAGIYQLGFGGLSLALGLVIIAVSTVLSRTPNRISTLVATLTGFVYIPCLLSYFILILRLPANETSGLILAFWVVVLVKFADIGAYLTGTFIGRTKLAPSLSPGKTWEGAAGGVAISALLSAAYVWYFQRNDLLPEGLTPLLAAAAALPIAAVSVVSDLVESAFKRAADVKDSGKTIPGIGGSFDLTDSLILSAPVAYGILLVITTVGP
jgi:phosphatidate cytidylyltransferase